MVHLGSTGCTGDPATGETVKCRAANRAAIALRRFDPKRQRIAVDLKALVAGNDIIVNRADAPGACPVRPTPSAAACSRPSASAGGRTAAEAAPRRRAHKQSVFRAIAR
jgi:hypothetical protein